MLAGFTARLTGAARGPHHAANQMLAQRTLIEQSERRLIALEGANAPTS